MFDTVTVIALFHASVLKLAQACIPFAIVGAIVLVLGWMEVRKAAGGTIAKPARQQQLNEPIAAAA